MKRSVFLLAVALLGFVAMPEPEPVDAQSGVTLTIAMRDTRRGSAWLNVMNAWNNSLQSATGGQVSLEFTSSDNFEARLGNGQLQGVSLPATDLGELVESANVLAAPGVIRDYDKADRVISRMGSEFEGDFERHGYKVLGWFDLGETRWFSDRALNTPEDLRGTNVWAPSANGGLAEFLRRTGGNPVRVGSGQVRRRLDSDAIDVVPSSALAAVFLQWYTRLSHVTQQSGGVVMAATAIRQADFDRLTDAQKQALLDTAERAHRTLRRQHRRRDAQAFNTVRNREGYTVVDISSNQAAWTAVADATRSALVGRAYSRALLRRVERAAR